MSALVQIKACHYIYASLGLDELMHILENIGRVAAIPHPPMSHLPASSMAYKSRGRIMRMKITDWRKITNTGSIKKDVPYGICRSQNFYDSMEF